MPTMSTRANVSSYEKSREDRIKANLERLQSLGITDLSLKLKSQIRPGPGPVKRPYCRRVHNSPDPDSSPLQLPFSTRRSSRLKNATPVTYYEEDEVKKGKGSREVALWIGRGERPEIYTEEHEQLLGNTERIWELFVDGYGKDGKRIYDPVNGKTCHQCRQKTLGYHTQCSQCQLVTGQLCGDCLYMRYGEHVLEALENPDWTCPVCRDICNCSICRTRKGWLPTGNAYRRVCKDGYKSVAHFLIQTKKQSETSEDDETDDAPSQASAKRSLSFKESKASSEEDDLNLEITDGVQDGDGDDDDTNKNADSARKSLSFLTYEENQTSVTDIQALGDLKPLDVNEMDPATPVIIDVDAEYEENQGTRSKRKMIEVSEVKPNPDSIGGRLRQRRKSQA
ncbi:hypothetical protein AALP_AA7G248900 [Arabis alpina]|uniref:Zinc-finger domain-containing protein n=1 Tax=Arabis alpina TaxID=50452 RepID=A0A087GKD7_ARAAL|nr:hypothetical protein AALP_AA7G248900 [Arabis alpina]